MWRLQRIFTSIDHGRYRSYLLILFSVKFYPFSLDEFGEITYNLEYWKLSSLYNIYDKNKSPTIVSIKLMVGGWSPFRGTAVWPCDGWDWDWVVSRTDGVTEGRREPQPRHSERTVITGKYWSWRCSVGARGGLGGSQTILPIQYFHNKCNSAI